MEHWKTALRLALLSFVVLLEAQRRTHEQDGDGGHGGDGGDGGDGGWSRGSHLSVDDEGPCNVDVLDGSSLSLRHFLDSYAYSRPAVITGLTDNAKFRSLCSKQNLLREYGDRQVRLSTANTYSYRKADVSFRHYVDVLLGPQSPEVLGSGPGTGVPFHWHGPGYSEVIYGRKRWFLYPPDEEPPFHPNASTLAWLRDVYPRLPPRQAPLQCTVRPGQVLYFPTRWWHATLNLDASVFISTFLG